MTIRVFCTLVIFGCLLSTSCSLSRSSSSPFRWSSNSIESSSKSSSGGEEETKAAEGDQSKYQQDVTETTAAAMKKGAGPMQIMREVGDVANEHGVTDWENEPGTFEAIGRGLKQGDASLAEFESLSEQLAAGSDLRKRLLEKGYTAAQ